MRHAQGSYGGRLYLKRSGLEVASLDIDPALEPDHVGSVTEIPFGDNAFDAVVCLK